MTTEVSIESLQAEVATLKKRLLDADIAREIALRNAKPRYVHGNCRFRADGCQHDLARQEFDGVRLPCAEINCAAGMPTLPGGILQVATKQEPSFASWTSGGVDVFTKPHTATFRRTLVVCFAGDAVREMSMWMRES